MPPVTLDFDIGSYLESDPAHMAGRPYIRGTRVSVQKVGILHSQGATADEIARRMSLSLPGVHAALAFYLSRREEIERDIDEQETDGLRIVEGLRAVALP